MALKAQRATGASSGVNGRRAAVLVVSGLRFFSKTPSPKPAPSPMPARSLSAMLTQQAARVSTSTLLERPDGALAGRARNHIVLVAKDLERSLAFYTGVLGLEVSPDRPHHKLPYRGAWLSTGVPGEMVHLMELDAPCAPAAEGARDRHVCVHARDVRPVVAKLEAAGVQYTASTSGRAAVVSFRDPDMNWVEVVERH